MKRLAGAGMVALIAFGARAEPSARLLPNDETAQVRYRPGAIGCFIGSALALGAGALFAAQSDSARAQLTGLSATGVNSGIKQAQAFSAFQTATTDGQIAVALAGGALALAGVGAALWWYGSGWTVSAGPSGVAVSGTFP